LIYTDCLARAHHRGRFECANAVFAATVSCLATVFANASAKADVFDFRFGPGVLGTFTTGAAASDPGYELITGLTFDLLSGKTINEVSFSFTDEVGSAFAPGAAFNPTTDAFINHANGSTLDDIGSFDTPAAVIIGSSFSQLSGSLKGALLSTVDIFVISASLEITHPTPPVPEPSTWALMVAGFAGLGFVGYRQTRRAKPRPLKAA
jgi:hypothetical protein